MSLELELLVAAWDNYKKNATMPASKVFDDMESSVIRLIDLEEMYNASGGRRA